jgi:hypothetical protein
MEETGLEVEVDGDVVGGVQLKMNFGLSKPARHHDNVH